MIQWLKSMALSLVVSLGMGLEAEEGLTPEGMSQAHGEARGLSLRDPSEAREPKQEHGMLLLDYQSIPVSGDKPLDLMGFHVFHGVTDWLYLGFGGHAPLFKGEYGGFMIMDVGAHLQRKVTDKFRIHAGLLLGGGGGGRSIEHSKRLSGTGGFVKSYLGMSYVFPKYAILANYSHIRLSQSAMDVSSLSLGIQIPFSYHAASFSLHGKPCSTSVESFSWDGSKEKTFVLGMDQYHPIRPKGTHRELIGVSDLQFSYFLSNHRFWYASIGIGYRGLPMYNQVLAGLGYRLYLSPRVHLQGQMGIGSGGYAPELVDTASGLLLYPKVSAEYQFSPRVGLLLSTGYVSAPKGSFKAFTYGAALAYHIHSRSSTSEGTPAGQGACFQGYRLSVLSQQQFHLEYKSMQQEKMRLLSIQLDAVLADHFFIPLQASVAQSAYYGYPGYGELWAGLGIQSRIRSERDLQFWGQMMAGTNVHGPGLQWSAGLHVPIVHKLAAVTSIGKTYTKSATQGRFRSDVLSLGLVYRFSLPAW